MHAPDYSLSGVSTLRVRLGWQVSGATCSSGRPAVPLTDCGSGWELCLAVGRRSGFVRPVSAHGEEDAFTTAASYPAQGWETVSCGERLWVLILYHSLGELTHNIFQPQLSYLKNGDKKTHFVILLGGFNMSLRIVLTKYRVY